MKLPNFLKCYSDVCPSSLVPHGIVISPDLFIVGIKDPNYFPGWQHCTPIYSVPKRTQNRAMRDIAATRLENINCLEQASNLQNGPPFDTRNGFTAVQLKVDHKCCIMLHVDSLS